MILQDGCGGFAIGAGDGSHKKKSYMIDNDNNTVRSSSVVIPYEIVHRCKNGSGRMGKKDRGYLKNYSIGAE
jgi:hypothetical protein